MKCKNCGADLLPFCSKFCEEVYTHRIKTSKKMNKKKFSHNVKLPSWMSPDIEVQNESN